VWNYHCHTRTCFEHDSDVCTEPVIAILGHTAFEGILRLRDIMTSRSTLHKKLRTHTNSNAGILLSRGIPGTSPGMTIRKRTYLRLGDPATPALHTSAQDDIRERIFLHISPHGNATTAARRHFDNKFCYNYIKRIDYPLILHSVYYIVLFTRYDTPCIVSVKSM
jgi:hypothetical protein